MGAALTIHKRIIFASIGILLLTTLIGYPRSYRSYETSDSIFSGQKALEVIVQKRQGSDSLPLIQSVGGVLLAETPIINGFVAKIPADSLPEFAQQEGVLRYTVSQPISLTRINWDQLMIGMGNQFSRPEKLDNVYREIVNADAVDEKGTGVTIAVLDSGIGFDPFSRAKLNVVRSIAINPNATTVDDLYGHGTHVAGIINGRGPGVVTGIAPSANLINVKLGDDQGNLTEIDLLFGLQWVYDFRDDYNIDVVNLSVSSDFAGNYLDSPVSAAVEQLWLNGVTVVAAAGNDKINPHDIDYAPANDPFIITVGAVDGNGQNEAQKSVLASWSKHGKTSQGVHKPEVTAPGVDIISLLPTQDSELAIEHPEAVINRNYFQMSGTSMAAPVVTGTIALMLEANPSLTPNEIKSILIETLIPYDSMLDGAGVINAQKAIEIAKDEEKLTELTNYDNTWPLSSYLIDSSSTLDWTKASWGYFDWTKASWGSFDWAKASWGNAYWTKASWGNADWTKASWGALWNSMAK